MYRAARLWSRFRISMTECACSNPKQQKPKRTRFCEERKRSKPRQGSMVSIYRLASTTFACTILVA